MEKIYTLLKYIIYSLERLIILEKWLQFKNKQTNLTSGNVQGHNQLEQAFFLSKCLSGFSLLYKTSSCAFYCKGWLSQESACLSAASFPYMW